MKISVSPPRFKSPKRAISPAINESGKLLKNEELWTNSQIQLGYEKLYGKQDKFI